MPSRQKKLEKKLVRLIAAIVDMRIASSIFDQMRLASDPALLEMLGGQFAVAYFRPFTQNNGAGPITDEFRDYPALEPPHIQKMHDVFRKLRNKFMAHSSSEGYKIFLIPAGVPGLADGAIRQQPNWELQRRSVNRLDFYEGIYPAVVHFGVVLSAQIRSILATEFEFPDASAVYELPTLYDDFESSIK